MKKAIALLILFSFVCVYAESYESRHRQLQNQMNSVANKYKKNPTDGLRQQIDTIEAEMNELEEKMSK